ncbi:flavoprotein [Nonomuraea sp. NPDC005983]|uniref:flavoprotein n=1 Tax=Nonomuraea sp. NPDC005983 TaxID=3155595 RepID=UPI0033A7D27F
MTGETLYVVVCAAWPAADVGRLVGMAQDEGWGVQVVATPAALDFVDVAELERQSGRPVRSRYRKPDEPKPPRADAIVVAPATFNTVNKFAQGIADTYALGVLAEAPGLGIPVVVLPCVNSALAARGAYRRSVEELRADGVRVPADLGPLAEDAPADAFPWKRALTELAELLVR